MFEVCPIFRADAPSLVNWVGTEKWEAVPQFAGVLGVHCIPKWPHYHI